MMEKPYISVIICTYNRCKSLKRTLESFIIQDYDGNFDYEIIVIDNNSNDQTKNIVDSFVPKFNGCLRYILELNQGQSYARNRGIHESQGNIVAFTDDDVIVDKQWLKALYEAFVHTGASCVYGKILPIWPNCIVPDWLKNNNKLKGKLALLDYGDKVFVATDSKHQFYGANFAVRKELLLKLGGFNVKLGMVGNRLTRGEDTELFQKILEAKQYKIIYKPDLIINHIIEAKRLSKSYFRKWYFDTGASCVVIMPKSKRQLFGVPFWFFKSMIFDTMLYINSFFKSDRKKKFINELNMISYIGFFYYKIQHKITITSK